MIEHKGPHCTKTFDLQNEREYILENTRYLFSGVTLPSSGEDDVEAGGETNAASSTDGEKPDSQAFTCTASESHGNVKEVSIFCMSAIIFSLGFFHLQSKVTPSLSGLKALPREWIAKTTTKKNNNNKKK